MNSDEGIGYCLVVNEDRYNFVQKYGEYDKKISKIKVHHSFRETPPSAEKVRIAKKMSRMEQLSLSH